MLRSFQVVLIFLDIINQLVIGMFDQYQFIIVLVVQAYARGFKLSSETSESAGSIPVGG